MKNKLLGSKTAGRIATIGELGERELFVNLVDRKIFTSDGNTVFSLTGSDIRGTEYSGLYNYGAGDIVSNAGKLYVSNAPNNQGNPLSDTTKWFNVKHIEVGGVAWKANTRYRVGDSVLNVATGTMYVVTSDGTSGMTFALTEGTLIFTDAFIMSNQDPGSF